MIIGLLSPNKCQRCSGNLLVELDDEGYYLECLQCGATHEFDGKLLVRNPTAEEINVRVFERHYGPNHGRHPNSLNSLKLGWERGKKTLEED